MTVEDLLVAAPSECRKRLDVLACGFAADIMVIHEVGCSGDIQGNRSGTDNGYALFAVDNLTIGEHFQAAFCLKTSWYTLLFHTFHDSS